MQKNRIELAGYLATKPELRYLPSGTKVANVRLGETYRFAGRDGKPQSHTNWHSLVFYNEIADVAMTYEQGENIHVEGSFSKEIHAGRRHHADRSRGSRQGLLRDRRRPTGAGSPCRWGPVDRLRGNSP